MNCPKYTIEEFHRAIAEIGEPAAEKLGEMLSFLHQKIKQNAQEANRLSEAQAAAIVNSAEIISELEETKERLEKMRLQAEASEAEAKKLAAFGDILEHSLNEIYIFDCKTLRILHANGGARKNSGFTMDELLKLTPLSIMPDIPFEKFEEMLAPLRQQASMNIEFKTSHKRKNGSSYPVEVHLELSVFKARPVYVAIIRDISYRLEMESRNTQLQKDLIEASRKAGMAEVATGVLHNVGNILNSVNVSTSMIKQQHSKSALANLEKVSNLISENESTFADFVRDDNRGQILPSYIVKVNDALCKERKRVNVEIDDLVKNVEHIKEIVAVQQSMAKSFGLMQVLSARELVEDVLTATKGSLQNHHVKIVKELGNFDIEFTTDRHKILQILINLVSNAKDALLLHNDFDRKIVLRVVARQECILFQVVDNGMGISKDKLDKIFQHGFTTKRMGHGFGLHCSANAAAELGGSLTAFSDGPGSGATFELRLPFMAESCPNEYVGQTSVS